MMQGKDKSDVINQTLFLINLMSKAQGHMLITIQYNLTFQHVCAKKNST